MEFKFSVLFVVLVAFLLVFAGVGLPIESIASLLFLVVLVWWISYGIKKIAGKKSKKRS